MLTSGHVLQARYQILRHLGGGGMGIVYLADDRRLRGRSCAIKEMSTDRLAPEERNWAIQAFRQEAQILATLRHPGLTTVTDFFAEGGCWYLVMDFVEGEALSEHLARRGGRLPVEEVVDIARQICDVLTYLHQQTPPVIFRDLKPDNIMLTPDRSVRLIDFGIARFFKPGQTQDTIALGTPGYAAPEQYGGLGQSDPRTDVYSLGAVMLHLATGFDPTTAQTPFPLPTVESLRQPVPTRLAQVIERATQLQPALRYPDMDSLQRELDPPTSPGKSSPQGPGKATGKPQSIRRWLLGGGAALLIAMMVACLILARTLFPDGIPLPSADTDPETATDTYPPTTTPTPTPTQTPTRTPTSTPTPSPEIPPEEENSPPVEPVSDGAIAFVQVKQDTNGNGKLDWNDRRVICLMNPDGGDIRPLTDSAYDAYDPAWSPYGHQLVFSARQGGLWRLYSMRIDDGSMDALPTGAGNARGASWSPDGRFVAYHSDQDGDDEIYIMDRAADDAVTQLTRNRVEDKYPVWSPDSTRLAFYSRRDGNQEIYIMNRDGSGQSNMTRHSSDDFWPAWSPDGRYIAFVCSRYSPVEICLLEVANGNVKRLTHSTTNSASPSWSPDGQHVIFAHWETTEYCEIYRVNVNTGQLEALTTRSGLNTRPVMWSP
jgi:Tol biopolymer transport system component